MSVEMGPFRTTWRAGGALLAALVLAAGCGGSGSSGFDIAPGSEGQAISSAIDDGRCVRFDRQTFCASGVPAESGHFEGASVTIDAPSEPLVCDPSGTGDACTASLAVVAEGFRVVNTSLAAVAETESGPWTLVPLAAGDDLEESDVVTITLPQENGAATKPLIAAVLVYRGVIRPEAVSLPETSAKLAHFGADLVYVSPRLEVAVPR